MIIFTLRRILLLIVTLFLLTFVGFSLSYFTPHAPLQGASLWNAWVFWFNGLIHWDFGVSSINGQPIAEQLKEVFPATMELCILAYGFALIVGIPVGMIAGITRPKWQDNFINAIALLGFSIPVFWLALLPRMVRSVYSLVHDELEKEYIIAARLDGASTLNILLFAILPNIASGLVTEITRALSMAILDIAALGFLDLGAQLPSPEWGAMLGDALELIYVAPWTVMLPGAAIMLSVLLVNLLGDGIRRAIIAGVE